MKLRPSRGMRLAENPLGRTLQPAPRREGWRHPWWTEVEWLPRAGHWAAYVRAGFVNGVCPVVRVRAAALREARGTFFGQLVDARAGAAEIEQLARLAAGGGEGDEIPGDAWMDVPLYQRPPVGLHAWRNIGWDGDGPVPEFFRDRGVKDAPEGIAEQLQSNRINLATMEQPEGNRLLRACDIWLQQPRTALTSTIEVTPSGFVSGTGLVNQTLGFRTPGAGERLKVQSGIYSPLRNANLNFAQRNPNLVASDYEEKTWDEVHICTVYLLSPPNAAPGSKPDAMWQRFVKHHAFWNLSWVQPRMRPVFNMDIFRPLVALAGILAGGAGIGSVSWLASSINDATQGAFNILQAQSLEGSFWTGTCAGTAGSVPVTVPEPELTGLDKAARAEAKKRQSAARKLARRLDPAFPHEGRAFNISLL